MEKVVNKIGDVTIDRRVPPTPLQNFTADRTALPQSPVKSQLDDLVTPYPQQEVLKPDNSHSMQYGVSPVPPRPVTQPQMGKSLDLQSEMEQKLSLPKGMPWDYKPPDNAHQRDWPQYDGRQGMRSLAQCGDEGGSQGQKRNDMSEGDAMRYGDVGMGRTKMPEMESEGRSRVDVNDTEYGAVRGERGSDRPEFRGSFPHDPKTAHGMGYSYPNMERLTHPGLPGEKGGELHSRQYLGNYNMSGDAHALHGKAFSSKSPIHLSSDEEKPMEEGEYDLKEMDDFEDGFDSEDYDEDDDATTVNEDDLSDGEKGEVKPFPRDGSPIVLSSEDDDRNDEDVVEVMDQAKFRDLTNSNSHAGDVTAENKFSEPIVVDDSFSDSSTKDNESKRLTPKEEPLELNSGAGVPIKADPDGEGVPMDEAPGMDLDRSEAQQDCTNPQGMDEELGDKTCKTEETDTEDGSGKVKEEPEDGSPPEDEGDETKKEIKTEPEDEESALKSSETELPASVGSADGEEKETKPDMSDIVCDDLMELMKKGEIEGEVEDDESEEDGEGKKGTKRKAEEGGDGGEKDETKSKSKKKKSEKTEEGGEAKDDDDKNIDKSKVTSANLRKNIREVMDEMKLDEATLSAQRQEAERLKRLQDQQRIIRELQKQIVMNRQNQKSQSRVLSLLQGNSQTSILKTSSSATPQTTATPAKSPNHVLVKLSNGQQTSLNNKKMIELLKNSKSKAALSKPSIPTTLLKQGMVSPSVSIAPIAKKEPPVDDKKKKKGDVVTLSSDSEDDCIVLSEEDESEPEEDPTNSGIHTTDKYNVPDEQGRVIVNVGHPESESDIFLAPQIARIIKPHQIGGIRFLYDNVIESLERFQSSTGFGCILAHSMGLGKTLQIVSFSDIFLRYTSAKTILCIMPINTIQNWLAEFNMWLPKENATGQDVRCREFELYIVNESLKNLNSRSKVILDWQKNGGVLLMGYELFRLLSLKKSCKSKKKKKEMDEKEDDAKNKELIEEVYGALVRPGPDLVICDEGHRIKNSHATTSQALKQIRTKRRIVLTGYPLQNNLLEYWCMVDFVRPNYLGSKTEFSNMFERPIQNGQCIDSTPQDKRLMRYRAHVLHSLLEGFVQRRSHAVLQSTLPEKEEYVLLLRFTPFQRKLYDTFMNEVVRTVAVPNPLKAFAVCCKIWNHPDVLYNFLKKKGEEIDLDLEEALPPSLQPSNYPFGQTPPDGMSQYPQSPMVPPWPRRGPGSRGGKVRQCVGNRRPGRGRKPAATVSPNLNSMPCDKKDEAEGYHSNSYSSSYPEYPHQNSGDGMMDGDRGNRNFGARGFNQYPTSDYGNHSNFTGSGYDNKNPLENLEDLSSGDFQNKRFYPQPGEGGMQPGFGGSSCMQQNSNYPQSMSQSSNSDMSAGYSGNLNRSDSRFSQSDATKPYQYNQDYNSEFYSGGNYPPPQANSEFDQGNKGGFNRGNAPPDASPYYQNSRYIDNREGNMGYNMQSTNANMDGYQGYPKRNPEQGFQQGNLGKHYQGSGSNQSYNEPSSNPGMSYPNAMMDPQRKPPCPGDMHNRSNYTEPPRPGESNYPRSEYQGTGSGYPSNYRDTTGYNCSQGESERDMTAGSNYQGGNSNFGRSGYPPPQDYWHGGSNWPACGFDSKAGAGPGGGGGPPAPDGSSNNFMHGVYDGGKDESKKFAGEEAERKAAAGANPPGYGVRVKSEMELESNYGRFDDEKGGGAGGGGGSGGGKTKEEGVQSKEEEFKVEKKEEFKSPEVTAKKEDALPYEWATDLFKNYVTGIIKNSSKMEVFIHILTESINLGDRLLVFSQSLLTLDLIEDYLHRQNVPNRDEPWAKNRNYFRLDGSTPGLEREKLINEFNANPNIFIFLVSTRAGSLGINLVGANRVVVFDASWNPCHDTQAVCRVYRYGQQKPCFVYRLVMDSCLEKKIYDRQINKQGMADRVVDELNPDAHLSIKEVTNLCWDDQEDTTVQDFAYLKDKYNDQIIKVLLENCSTLLSKEPFQHESLLIDRKEKKLSQAEKRLAKRSYELEKQAANQPKNMYSFFPAAGGTRNFGKPIASVRPMQSEMASRVPPIPSRSKWIPAEVWQKQGMSAQEMTLPLDVVIPTNAPDKTSIVLKAGQRVMVLKSPKGIYMQLENGKIIAIRTAFKVGQGGAGSQTKGDEIKKAADTSASSVTSSLKNNPNLTITSKSSPKPLGATKPTPPTPFIRGQTDKKPPISVVAARSKQILGKAKPLLLNRKFQSVTPEIRQRLLSGKSNFDSQEDKMAPMTPEDDGDVILAKDSSEAPKYDGVGSAGTAPAALETVQPEKRAEERVSAASVAVGKGEMTSSLETLRKVTENIKEDAKAADGGVGNSENSQVQMNSLKNYRHNFSSQLKSKTQDSDDEKDVKAVTEVEGGGGGKPAGDAPPLNGNENVQNWLMNQSYPPVDPYGNYFPSYYGYGHGPGAMMSPYEGFYPNSYPHLGRNAPGKPETQPEASKTAPPPASQPQSSSPAQAPPTPATTRASSNTVYPPYANPYQYPYNYPSNPGFNNQTYPFPSQNQNSQTPNSGTSSGSSQSYDNSMYSAFHRPDGHFQGSDNAYPSPYRPPYPNSNTPGFFPYNAPYRPYPDPNYHYGPNFNPYMHPPGYGYPVQNPPAHGANPAFNQHATEPATNSS